MIRLTTQIHSNLKHEKPAIGFLLKQGLINLNWDIHYTKVDMLNSNIWLFFWFIVSKLGFKMAMGVASLTWWCNRVGIYWPISAQDEFMQVLSTEFIIIHHIALTYHRRGVSREYVLLLFSSFIDFAYYSVIWYNISAVRWLVSYLHRGLEKWLLKLCTQFFFSESSSTVR